jgi:hypothetical protein
MTGAQRTQEPAADGLGHTDSLRLLGRQARVLELLASGASLDVVLTSMVLAL